MQSTILQNVKDIQGNFNKKVAKLYNLTIFLLEISEFSIKTVDNILSLPLYQSLIYMLNSLPNSLNFWKQW